MPAILSFIIGPAKKPIMIILALVAAYFFVKSTGYDEGYAAAELKYLTEKQTAITAAINEVNQKNQRNNQISKKYWEKQLAQKPKLQTIEKRIIEYVEKNNGDSCMLDDDELLILTELTNAANGNTKATNRPGVIATLPSN